MLQARLGVTPIVVTSDDPQASRRIAAFATGCAPWIVAVRMVSEGVDIPRLRVGVYATTTGTDLFFRQAVGRLVRAGRARQGGQRRQPDEKGNCPCPAHGRSPLALKGDPTVVTGPS